MALDRTPALALVAALTVAMLPACSTQISGPILVLHLASPDRANDETAAPIQHFADEVDRRSDGTIRIEPVWDVATIGMRDWDQVTARTVIDEENELALVPGRAFDTLGVRTLRALNTPFLITNQAALEEVLDSDLRAGLLAGLPAAGLVGIDVFPDGMRHPFGYEAPLRGAEDYADALISAPTSATTSRLFETLGATVIDHEQPSTRGGAEAQFSLAPAGTKVATGNVTFFPKTNVLVAHHSVADRLRSDQWELLELAAAATRDWQFGQQASEFEQASEYCDRGGTIIAASDADLASLEAAAADVTAWLREDDATRELVDQIARRVEGLPAPAAITECPGARGVDIAALDGKYAWRVSRRDLLDAGVTDENIIRENTGRVTWTLDSGRWTYNQVANHYLAHPSDAGVYRLEGNRLTIFWTDNPGNWTRLRVRVGQDRDLHFSDIKDGLAEDQALSEGYFRRPAQWVGDAPD